MGYDYERWNMKRLCSSPSLKKNPQLKKYNQLYNIDISYETHMFAKYPRVGIYGQCDSVDENQDVYDVFFTQLKLPCRDIPLFVPLITANLHPQP